MQSTIPQQIRNISAYYSWSEYRCHVCDTEHDRTVHGLSMEIIKSFSVKRATPVASLGAPHVFYHRILHREMNIISSSGYGF